MARAVAFALLGAATALVVQDRSVAELSVAKEFQQRDVAQFVVWASDRLQELELIEAKVAPSKNKPAVVNAVAQKTAKDSHKTDAEVVKNEGKTTGTKNIKKNATKVDDKRAGKDKSKKDANPMDQIGSADMLKKIKGSDKVQLMLMKGMLQGMYDKFKSDIGRANKQEVGNKGKIEKYITEVEQRIAKRKAKLAKVHSNMTDDSSTRILNYWKKVRVMHKRHYHSMLRLSHAGMARIKKTLDAIDAALAGTLSQKSFDALRRMVPSATPDVVLVQEVVAHAIVDISKDIHSFLQVVRSSKE